MTDRPMRSINGLTERRVFDTMEQAWALLDDAEATQEQRHKMAEHIRVDILEPLADGFLSPAPPLAVDLVVFHRDDFDRIMLEFRCGRGEIALLGEAELSGPRLAAALASSPAPPGEALTEEDQLWLKDAQRDYEGAENSHDVVRLLAIVRRLSPSPSDTEGADR